MLGTNYNQLTLTPYKNDKNIESLYLRSESLFKFSTKILSSPELHAIVSIVSRSSLGV